MNTLQTISKQLPLSDVNVNDSFWSEYIKLVRNVVIPYQWAALNDRIPDVAPSHAIKNFRIAAGLEQGEFHGNVFQDSDVAKWLEAVSYLLATERDPDLERIVDELIDTIEKAQHQDGYLNTYFTLKEPDKRWTNLAECHELYCAGHMIEAAVAYYKATGKRKLLEIVNKFVNYIDEVFGIESEKLKGYDGHQEVELALMKLFEVTGNERCLSLCQFFLRERGRKPHYYDIESEKRGGTVHFGRWIINNKEYSQAHELIQQQEKAVGHAVRFVYMCTGLAHLAAATGDPEIIESCNRLWDNMANKQMYITGGIGSQGHGEAFSIDYDLPNDTVYAETCASVGLIFFAQRMLMLQPNSRYADAMERSLYNTVLSGMSQDGRSFFYVNPLEVIPHACGANHIYDHIRTVRQGWFGCACCPPNVARLISSLGQYVYTVQDKTVYVNLYIGGDAKLDLNGEQTIIKQRSNYPWDGNIHFTIDTDHESDFTLALRIPEWCDHAEVSVNGVALKFNEGSIINGYAMLQGNWKRGDQIILELPMNVQKVKGHPLIRQTAGKIALQRGPLVYCIEEVDNGANLHNVFLTEDADFEAVVDQDMLGGLTVITAAARRINQENWGENLYKRNAKLEDIEIELKFIPYFAWANRGEGEMRVWVNEK